MKENTLTDNIQLEIFKEYLVLRGYTIKTQQAVIRTVTHFSNWAQEENIVLEDMNHNGIIAYVNHCKKRGNKQRTLQINVGYIKHYYNFLISKKEINHNPCSDVDIRGVKRKILYETFTPEELETMYKVYGSTQPAIGGIGSKLAHKRNKIILGLIIYQGMPVEDIGRLKITDINVREGKVYIGGRRRSNEREMALEAHQLYDMMDYINEVRKIILSLIDKQTDILFVSLGIGDRFNNITTKILKQLKKQNKRIKDLKQIRTSVISNWLKVHNIRRVQYMAGHRYVSSTESYQANNMDSLKEDIEKYHPIA